MLPINTENTSEIQTKTQGITIKERLDTLKILGIHFHENLKTANKMKWNITLEKMQKHIQKLSSRILSVNGKTTLINTLILSKTSYLSNIFPLDIETITKINEKIFKYLWNNKISEPIARKTIHLNKKLGGLNLIESEAHKYAMRIKHLLSLKQKHKPPPWKCLATYWLSIDIHKYSKEYQFLMSNNRSKTLATEKPFYYHDLIKYIKNYNYDITKTRNETKTIYQKVIQEGSKHHTIAGETQWKNKITNINFQKIWKNTFTSYAPPPSKDLHYRLLHSPLNAAITCTNVQKTLIQTANIADSSKIIYTYS